MLNRDTEIQDSQRETRANSASECAQSDEEIERIVRIALDEDSYFQDHRRGDTFHTPLWAFTRVVKSLLQGAATAHAAFEMIEPAIDACDLWGRLATAFGESMCSSDAYAHFAYAWNRIIFKLGEAPLDVALRWAERTPLLPERCSDTREPYARLISIAGWLQVLLGDRRILLPIELLSGILGVSAMHVSRLRHMAIGDGYLRVVSAHSHKAGRATEFRFDTTRFEELPALGGGQRHG